jgi:demethylmenaquinone methyltransferase / 2-methoxy-6-polyprenyl-1,4-benzoquinol methylase
LHMEKRVDSRYPSVKKVTDQERIEMVKEIFATVPGKYDFLNHFLSLRRDIAWRRFTVRKMSFTSTRRFLDVACGTADLSLDAARAYPEISVSGLDFVMEMLDIGQAKVRDGGLSKRIRLMKGDALDLPFRDNSFDVSGMAFGIRNIPDKSRALGEMMRVVVPGGQVMILEMTFTRNWFSNLMYHTYLNHILPRVAKRFSMNPGAYHYLADSIMNFPAPGEFVRIMEDAGLKGVEKYKLTLGATYLYVGKKPLSPDGTP